MSANVTLAQAAAEMERQFHEAQAKILDLEARSTQQQKQIDTQVSENQNLKLQLEAHAGLKEKTDAQEAEIHSMKVKVADIEKNCAEMNQMIRLHLNNGELAP